ncbi:MAG: formylmethanofuran dehydrogenase subunit A [Beijerinckiaceae bacterium]|nr:MAG: formylmethanofuran dehydrogenase subunit A [Beijerinckiaceae bacterium]
MLIRLSGGRVIDPANGRDGIGDIWIKDDRIVDPPANETPDKVYDISGKIVMAGAIDIHSHIAGGNVNTARLLLPENHRAHTPRPAATPLSTAGWSTFETGCRYAAMGYTTVIEPAVPPHFALHSHLELADIPIIDKGTLSVLGNDDYLLSLIRDGAGPAAVADYVGATLNATKSIGVKCINPGAAMAFKHNVRSFALDDVVPSYDLSSRKIMETLQQAVMDLGIPHPLHLHTNNLGMGGNVETAIATIEAARGKPLHLAHLQFYAYGMEGKRAFSSAAARLAEAVNAHPNVTIDVGQVMFRQTVTVSLDVLRQFNAIGTAHPKKTVIFDNDGDGAGVVPFNYRSNNFYNAVQWASGLELFLLINDPMRVFFSTDHPNGAPYTTYPDLFALIMSRDARARWLADLPEAAVEMTTLPSISREYSFNEIATMTRVAPAKILGLTDRGHLGPGSLADIAIYHDDPDRAAMFRFAHLVFKDGDLVIRDGRVTHYRFGRALKVSPTYDSAIDRRLSGYYNDLYGISQEMFNVPASALGRENPFGEVACGR